jgi:hypothetical protein
MARKRGRPPNAANLRNRDADHRDCLEIARRLRADPQLSLWDAVFTITGATGPFRHQDARSRRLRTRYRRLETYYSRLAETEAKSRRPVTASSLATIAHPFDPALRAIQAQLDTHRRIQAMFDTQRDLERLVRGSLPKLWNIP